MKGRFVLALDGSTNTCTAALLAREGRGVGFEWRVAAARTQDDARSQARVLLHLVDDMVREVGCRPEDLAAIVAGTGPGTFTGVRITVATARALALALTVPVVGVSTLAALAAQAVAEQEATGASGGFRPGLVAPLVDARRGQVFYGVYRKVPALAKHGASWVREQPYAACDRTEIGAVLGALASGLPAEPAAGSAPNHGQPGQLLLVGEPGLLPDHEAISLSGGEYRQTHVAAEWLVKGQDRLEEPGDSLGGRRLHVFLAEMEVNGERVTAEMTAKDPGEVGTPESVKPIYVRSPDADVHITKMRDPWGGGR